MLGYDGNARPIARTELGRRRVKTAWKVLGETVHPALWRIPDAERRVALEALRGCERALVPLRPPWWPD